MDRELIKNLCEAGAIEWEKHSRKRMVERGITQAEIESVLLNGEIIEAYPDNHPLPRCLMLGNDKPLHVVCDLTEYEVMVVTAYYPDTQRWLPNFKTRKEQK